MNNQDIVDRIKRVRKERGYTQQDLADFVQKTGSNISEMERGKVQVNASDLHDIAKALGKPIEFFYGYESDDPLFDDLKELLREETPEARRNTLYSVNLSLSMKHKIDRLKLVEEQPSENDILEFLHDFIAYSRELDRQNEEVKKIKLLLLEELKKQGLDLSQDVTNTVS
ncbi:MAG: helix-turn-helix transcriptional regulator [Anaerolineaceae bacterium]|nr:helix-turn-helix transcriptional regulator [Anaerolineaceae bacterium]